MLMHETTCVVPILSYLAVILEDVIHKDVLSHEMAHVKQEHEDLNLGLNALKLSIDFQNKF